jgi:RNA polymerase sigma-70 factor, ECF subfamily
MTGSSSHEVTQLLLAWGNGDEAALDRLVPHVEAELRRLAQLYLSRERANHTLQPTALVNEAFVRLIDGAQVQWQNRAHFFGVTAQLMRRILADHARRHQQEKRGGDWLRVSLVEAEKTQKKDSASILALDAALANLEKFDPRKSRIVELKFFGGLREEEIAEVLGLALRTVQRDWNLARAWLFNELQKA